MDLILVDSNVLHLSVGRWHAPDDPSSRRVIDRCVKKGDHSSILRHFCSPICYVFSSAGCFRLQYEFHFFFFVTNLTQSSCLQQRNKRWSHSAAPVLILLVMIRCKLWKSMNGFDRRGICLCAWVSTKIC